MREWGDMGGRIDAKDAGGENGRCDWHVCVCWGKEGMDVIGM